MNQAVDIFKKKRPLIHLEENNTRITNKYCKDVQARNLELSIQACLWLCQKNQMSSLGSLSDDGNRPSEEITTKDARLISRSRTANLNMVKSRANERFDRKITTDISFRKPSANHSSPKQVDPTDSDEKESEEIGKKNNSEFSKSFSNSEENKKRGRGRPPLPPILNKRFNKRTTQAKVKARIRAKQLQYR